MGREHNAHRWGRDGIPHAIPGGVVHFEREMYGVDVLENVFRGVQVLSESTRAVSGQRVDFGVRECIAGTAISTVRVQVLDRDD
jgi:hypothetical protein